MIVLFKDLRERPAALLQPKAPKPGKRIFLNTSLRCGHALALIKNQLPKSLPI